MAADRHRCYCFTINNYTSRDLYAVKFLEKKALYIILGEEVGEKGTPHYQGYIRLRDSITMGSLAKSLTRAHLIVANGTDEQNKTYCSKQKVIYEYGTPSAGQGTRTDIKEVADLIRSGKITLEDCMFDYPELYLKYSRSLEKMFNAVQPKRNTRPKVYWRWGLAGTGKTRWAVEKYPEHYIKDNTMWWDGYKQQQCIIIDDFENEIPYRVLLRMLDRYEYNGQVKGGYVQINSPIIVITCEYPPEHFWSGNKLIQITRRLEDIIEVV